MTLIEWRGANLPTTQRVDPKIAASARKRSGRNEACPCGSGKTYKNWCGLNSRRYHDPFRSRQKPGRLVQQLSSSTHRTGPGNHLMALSQIGRHRLLRHASQCIFAFSALSRRAPHQVCGAGYVTIQLILSEIIQRRLSVLRQFEHVTRPTLQAS